MNIKARVLQLERRWFFRDAESFVLTNEECDRFDHLFKVAERANGPPPCNPDGSLTSDMEVLAAWVDACPV